MSNQPAFQAGPVPVATGIGLRPPHFKRVLAERPSIAWFEVHSENFFCARGEMPRMLEAMRCNAVLNNHAAALRTAYPEMLALVGKGFFEAIVARYLCDYSSGSGNRRDYRADFPAAFLEAA